MEVRRGLLPGAGFRRVPRRFTRRGTPSPVWSRPGRSAVVFHAGTRLSGDGTVLTNGGRVLGVTATGLDLEAAIQAAYAAAKEISFTDMQFRTDIGRV